MQATELCALLRCQVAADEVNVAKADEIVRHLRHAGEDVRGATAVLDIFVATLREHRRLLDEAAAKLPVEVVDGLTILLQPHPASAAPPSPASSPMPIMG